MKIKLLILFLFAALAANAQNREVVSDTLYIANEGGKIFIYSYTEFTDGSRKGNFPNGSYRESAPDTATAVNFIMGEALGKARQYSIIAQQALQKPQTVQAITTLNSAVVNFTGISIADSLRNQLAPILIGEDWTFRASTGAPAQNVTVTQNAQGLLRMNFGGGVIRTVVPFAETWLRILNYPSQGQRTDFYLMPSGSFVSVGENTTRSASIRKESLVKQLAAQNARQ